MIGSKSLFDFCRQHPVQQLVSQRDERVLQQQQHRDAEQRHAHQGAHGLALRRRVDLLQLLRPVLQEDHAGVRSTRRHFCDRQVLIQPA